jgi:hypothetical protein
VTETKDTKDTAKTTEEDPNANRATVWMDAGHLPGDLPEGVVPQSGKVLVYADNGEVVEEQPDLTELKKQYDEDNAQGVPAPDTNPELVPPGPRDKPSSTPSSTSTGSTSKSSS